ncbi:MULTISPECIES: PBSX family phage terminase large subunit [Streptococcus]|uniref:PBSX family phage terminase large subunit n=1 Tax=Streptococcus TaxID=1301 RepID=UPI0008A9EFCD|nr:MULTISPECIES: PBSX family phage terminase large subunit [Streptococcus]KAA9249552.1 PBSX family phage terminase large subunit [Streptococcus anginosus]MCW1062053.1 PBSX family phage terminase large subunit [Streptococcus anginosus]MED5767189.1 PBSX family phage terminase large subunit [Streptococcus anginosus]MED5887385.1 PBSX family phage terminase large subunit [Streptococcus anginosus]MED5974176.1 PBSX family phage terminase large subunit [Streptococcus anginosus]
MTFNVQKNVNPHFKPVWISGLPYNVLKGGRNSFKSSVIALKLVYMMLRYIKTGETANVVVIRKVANTIRDSVFNKIWWALNLFGVGDKFKKTVSPFQIIHKKTGSIFYFYGQDDFQKLKSNDIGNLIAVWYEEAAEFASREDFDQSNVTFMRQKHPRAKFVQFFWSYNPPRNPYSWINEWFEDVKTNDNYLAHSSTYLDDELGFVTDQMLEDIERIKENDYDYYRYLYLGEAVGLGNNVYNMSTFHAIETLPSDDKLIGISFALDGGHQQSATAVCAFGITAKGKVILLDTWYYSPAGQIVKKAPSQLSQDINSFINRIVDKYKVPVLQYTIDSAEGALRNQMYLDFAIRWHPVAKLKKVTMIDSFQSLLAQGRFYYLDTENNKIFIEEHKMYRWDEKTIKSDNPNVIKEDDHTCDTAQYFVLDNAKILGLRVGNT